MGFRILDMQLAQVPGAAVLVEQVAAFAAARGLDAYLDFAGDPPERCEVTLQGNSTYLNDMTPDLRQAALQIAADIDPGCAELQALATEIGRQLGAQIVDWSGVSGITAARPGRELVQRLAGDSGYAQLLEEVEVHLGRVTQELAEYAALLGPRAWQERDRLALALRVDGLALVAAGRRFQRVAEDLAARLSSPHLDAALTTFRAATFGLVQIRDVAEHIDEYGIGSGRLDRPRIEPGQAIDIEVGRSELWISARSKQVEATSVGAAVKTLALCLAATAENRAFMHYLPGLADVDFTVDDGEGGHRIVERGEESAEMLETRRILTSKLRHTDGLPHSSCPHCGLAV